MTTASPTIDRVGRDTARARLERILYLAVGIAGVVYGVLLYPGSAGIAGQSPQLLPGYSVVLIFVSIAMPVLFGILTWFVPREWMRALAGGNSIMFLAVVAMFPFAVINDHLLDDQVPWYQGIHALHAMVAAIVWQRKEVWIYGVLQGPVIGWSQYMVRPDSAQASMLDALGSSEFALILMGAAVAVVYAADRQDRATHRARAQAARGAATRTREREETRINAMVHDDIMSVLLTASRENPPASLGDQAQVALHSIGTLDERDATTREYSPEEFISAIHEAVYTACPDAEFVHKLEESPGIPAEAVSAISDAVAEALRNSARHAGIGNQPVNRRVAASVTEDAASVVITDDGRGFNPRQVAARRLGIRLSIMDRMHLVPGGDADVRSKPGEGTTVILIWRRAA